MRRTPIPQPPPAREVGVAITLVGLGPVLAAQLDGLGVAPWAVLVVVVGGAVVRVAHRRRRPGPSGERDDPPDSAPRPLPGPPHPS